MIDIDYLISPEFDRDLLAAHLRIADMFTTFEEPVQAMLLEQIKACTDRVMQQCIFATVNRRENPKVYSLATFSRALKTTLKVFEHDNKEISPKFRPVFCPALKVQSNIYVTHFRDTNIYKYMWSRYGEKFYDDDAVLIKYSRLAFCDLILTECALIYMKYGFINHELLFYATLYITFKVFTYTSIPFDVLFEFFDDIVETPGSWSAIVNRCGGIERLKQISPKDAHTTKPKPKSMNLKKQILELYRHDKNALLSEMNKHPSRESFYAEMKSRYGIGERSLRQIAADHGLTRQYNLASKSAE